MKNKYKTKAQLRQEISELRQKLAELEVARETRKRMEEELKSSHKYLRKLNDSLQEVIFTVRIPERIIAYVNQSVVLVFGYEPRECLGRSTEFLYPTVEEYHDFGNKLNDAIDEGKDALHVEHLLRRRSGEVFPAEITTTFFKEEGRITQCISIIRDITERQRAGEELRKSKARLAEAQRIAHLGYWDWDIVKNELLWSDEIYRIFGLTPQQFGATYEAFLSSVHPDDREFVEQSVNEALCQRRPYSIDHRIVLPDGTVRVVHEKAEVTSDKGGRPIRMVGTAHDITEHKRAEDELRALSNRLVQLQEEERRTISRELHDQIGQSLTVLKLMLDKAGRLPAEDIVFSLNEAKALLNELMGQVRNLSLDLRPAMLDNLGLLPALLWLFDRYAIKTEVNVDFKHDGLERYFPPETSVAAYRIVQEALTNVMRHAHVNEVAIHAWAERYTLCLLIEDKGIGFDLTRLPVGISSGLYGMQERARALGGKLVVQSTLGVGTIIKAELPLSDNRQGATAEDRYDYHSVSR